MELSVRTSTLNASIDSWSSSLDSDNSSVTSPCTLAPSTVGEQQQKGDGEESYVIFNSIIQQLDFYFVPVVVLTGLVGNTLSFIVFVFSHLRRLSSSVYLAGLAVADTGFLLCICVSWSNNIGIHIYHVPGWCQTFVYLTYVWGFLSVWYIVSFSVERYIAVCYPFKRRTMCTVNRARIVLLALSLAAMVLYNFALWTSAVRDTRGVGKFCRTLGKYEDLMTILTTVDSVLTLVIPYVAIFVLNARIILAVVQLQRQRRKMNAHTHSIAHSTISSETGERDVSVHATLTSCKSSMSVKSHAKRAASSSSATSAKSSKNNNMQHPSQMKVTKTLVLVSTIFLLLNLPLHLVRLHLFVKSYTDSSYNPGKLYRLTVKLFQYIFYMNFSINFFLYNTSGQSFRQALFNVFKNTRCFRAIAKGWRGCRRKLCNKNFSSPTAAARPEESTLMTQMSHAPLPVPPYASVASQKTNVCNEQEGEVKRIAQSGI